LRSHVALWEYADILAEKIKDSEFRYLWRTANVLHQNFYEKIGCHQEKLNFQ
jgi:xylose isomerase